VLTQLRDVLARLYGDEADARRVVADAGINSRLIAFSSKAITNWQAILVEAHNQDQVEALIEVALKDYSNNKSLLGARQAYQEWMAQGLVSTSGQPDPGKPDSRGRTISLRQKMQLVDALLTCQIISNRETRNTIVNDLPVEIKHNIQRNANDRVDVVNIVTTVLNYSNGLEELVELVRLYEGNSIGMQEVEHLLSTIS
jgi:hypothetical protein